MKKIPIVMDCDPGSDDALAILMVHAAENIDLRAITTVAGNLNREITAKNALDIVEYFNIGVPVAKGSYPIMKKFEALDISIMGAVLAMRCFPRLRESTALTIRWSFCTERFKRLLEKSSFWPQVP